MRMAMGTYDGKGYGAGHGRGGSTAESSRKGANAYLEPSNSVPGLIS